MLQYSESPAAAAVLDRTFGALADPARRSMVDRLARGPATVTELAGPLQMSLSAVLQHVRVLEDSGLVATSKLGRTRVVTPSGNSLDTARDWIREREAFWHTRLDALGEVLASSAAAAPSAAAPAPTRHSASQPPRKEQP
jgi:DNA-binding transcriptional ArsR family regulator